MGNYSKKIAIMQPYIFPYLGYFQLINAVDEFVFYDDVNFIKRGWINRNRILYNNHEKLITFPCIKPSQNKLIKDIVIDLKQKEYSNLIETLKQAYNKAPFFHKIYPMIESILNSKVDTISDLAIKSVSVFCDFLEIDTELKISSVDYSDSVGEKRVERLVNITKKSNSYDYINALGGKMLYDKSEFKNKGINLYFLKPNLKEYNQFEGNNFVSGLSMIDIMMFNDLNVIKGMLENYTIE